MHSIHLWTTIDTLLCCGSVLGAFGAGWLLQYMWNLRGSGPQRISGPQDADSSSERQADGENPPREREFDLA